LDFLKTGKLRFFEGLLALYRGSGDLRRALRFLADRLGSSRLGSAASLAAEHLEQGRSLTQALTTAIPELSPFERGLLEVGEHAGNLDQALAGIIEELQLERRAKQELFTRLAYPVFILHFAGFVFSFVQSLAAGWSLGWPALYFGLLYAPVLAGWIVVRRLPTNPGLERSVLAAPLLGAWLLDRLRSRLAFSLGQLYTAGVPIGRALEISASGLGSGLVAAEVRQSANAVARGEPLSHHVPPLLDDALLRDAISVGEQSGALTEQLERAHAYYRDQANRELGRMVRVVYGVTFTVAVLVVFYLVLKVYGGYYRAFV